MAIPYVTIIIPAYNAQATLDRALQSALSQSFTDWHGIIVDDGSMDSTVLIARKYCNQWPDRFTLLTQKNWGPASARNLALKHTRAEYVAFLDSDDAWLPKKLETQLALMNVRPDVALCHAGAYKVDGKDRIIGEIRPRSQYHGRCFYALLVYNGIVTTTVLAKTRVLLDLKGFDEGLRTRNDWDMWIRVSQNHTIEYQSELLAQYRVHQSNISNDLEQTLKDHLSIIRKNANYFSGEDVLGKKLLTKSKSEVYYQYGVLFYVRRHYKRSASLLIKAAGIYPANLRVYTTFVKLIVRWVGNAIKFNVL